MPKIKIEEVEVQQILRDNKFDSFYVLEDGIKNLAVYDPNQVKAVFNSGEYSLEKDEILALRSQTGTSAFKKWFGDPKVIDANGEPLVVYHGTTAREDFSEFYTEEGSHFGTLLAAEARIGMSKEVLEEIIQRGGPGEWQEGRRIIPVYLSIQNPKRVKDTSGSWADIIAQAKEEGYDGIVYKNRFEGRGKSGDSWIAFEKNQIKSAIGNTGAFDLNDPDILASRAVPMPDWIATMPPADQERAMTLGNCFADAHDLITQLLNEVTIGPKHLVEMEFDGSSFQCWCSCRLLRWR